MDVIGIDPVGDNEVSGAGSQVAHFAASEILEDWYREAQFMGVVAAHVNALLGASVVGVARAVRGKEEVRVGVQ